MTLDNQPLVVIVGPTASGKTSLAIKLAEEYEGEIVCADSRTIYKYMDIGTAKPTKAERARVPHWGLDLVEPGEYFSAADFKAYALVKIEEIRSRGKIPFLVGGTGLYIDAIIFDYEFGNKSDAGTRRMLEAMDITELHEYCNKNNIILPNNKYNKRYVIRAIEQNGVNTTRRETLIENTIVVGITTESTKLRTRIELRSEQLFDDGVVKEAIRLGEKYGWGSEAMKGNVYPVIHDHLRGLITEEEMKVRFVTLDWRLAKRQITWLKRNTFIHWVELGEAGRYIAERLAKPNVA